MKQLIFLFAVIALPFYGNAQWLTGMATKWNDSFVEWTIFGETDEEEIEGDLQMRWIQQNDWSQWSYQIGDERGSIELTFKNSPSQWEIRGFGETVTARTRWTNDFSEWRITNNSSTFIFKSRWRNNNNEWILTDEEYGSFALVTEWENDPRSWRIYDELSEDIAMPMKMAMAFIAVFHSSPKQ